MADLSSILTSNQHLHTSPASVSQPAHDFFLYVTTEIYHYLDALACPISIDRVDVSCRGHENEQVSSTSESASAASASRWSYQASGGAGSSEGKFSEAQTFQFVKDLETAPQKGIRHKIGRIQSPDY
ncbi:hypothetical protein PROFUN_13777 [Planoprotostelium fungivorum]|uniref:Uncharacterized protein n=1 Tax=Planoprotostelium fungivorum TaxID=1890364 RepID=A0A2P6N261_9EUKA|nr:hypothetical protein PROFUN_13777 [Planoprotostelium fungivorum]